MPVQVEIYQIFEFEVVFEALVLSGVGWQQTYLIVRRIAARYNDTP